MKYVLKNSDSDMPSRRCSSSVTPVIEFAIGASAPSRIELGVRQPAHDAIAMAAELEVELDFDGRARAGAHEANRFALAAIAGFPYSAQAIASRIVVLPEPFGPMMPVRPVPKLSSVRVLPEVRELEAVESHAIASSFSAAQPPGPPRGGNAARARRALRDRCSP